MPGKTKEIAVPAPVDFKQWVEVMRIQAAEVEDDSEFDPRELLGSAHAAASFEDVVEILLGGSTKSAKNLVGIVHTVESFTLRKSDAKYAGQGQDLGVFMVVQALADGERLVYTTGAANIIALLWNAEKFDRLPLKGSIVSRETAGGELLSFKPSS